MAQVREPTKHEIEIGIGMIKQVVQNRSHPLDIIREALSNSCSREVKASYFKITVFFDGEYGYSLIFEDDGIGMNYTGEKEPEKQGRLDRFLNIAYSGAAGLWSDEFGFKGLGSKLMYLCKKLEIETKTGTGEQCKVVVDNPYGKLLKQAKPEMPKPFIYKDSPVALEHGTKIRVFGYDDGRKCEEYDDIDKLERYLHYRTLVGYTRPERLSDGFPKIYIKTPAVEDHREVKVGFPWINKEGTHVDGQKIGVIKPPITVVKQDKKGNRVSVTLKGGYALKTGEFGMSPYGGMLSAGLGLTYSWKGIPYFNLDFSYFKPKGTELYYKFCRLVVECDDIDTNIARSSIVADGTKEPLFTDALREAFRRVIETQDYKDWAKQKSELKKKELAVSLNQRIDELQAKNQQWVYYKDQLIHKRPDNEQDTRALLWKLEMLHAIPFHQFRTLEHTAQRGIDIIGEYTESEFSKKVPFASIETEHMLENFESHDHVPDQTSLIIAWDSRDRDALTKINGEWRYTWEYAGKTLNVILLRYLPGLELKSKG